MLVLSLLLRNICASSTKRRAVCYKVLSGCVCSSHWSTHPVFKVDLVAHKNKLLPSLKFLQAWLNDWRYRERYSDKVLGQPCDKNTDLRQTFHSLDFFCEKNLFLWVPVCVICKNLILTSAWGKLKTILLETWQVPYVVCVEWYLKIKETLQCMQPAVVSLGKQANQEAAVTLAGW